MTDDCFRNVIRQLQEDLPLNPTPYQEIARRIGSTEEEVFQAIAGMLKEGVIRRIGAVLYHQQAGVRANVMGVWKVSPEKAQQAGKIMASFPQVSHCYERPATSAWDYNLYTMIHGKDFQRCSQIALEISRKCGITEYKLLPSTREFKKSSMKYFK
jgi:DNA-binding Lrp family transcriptional regulator